MWSRFLRLMLSASTALAGGYYGATGIYYDDPDIYDPVPIGRRHATCRIRAASSAGLSCATYSLCRWTSAGAVLWALWLRSWLLRGEARHTMVLAATMPVASTARAAPTMDHAATMGFGGLPTGERPYLGAPPSQSAAAGGSRNPARARLFLGRSRVGLPSRRLRSGCAFPDVIAPSGRPRAPTGVPVGHNLLRAAPGAPRTLSGGVYGPRLSASLKAYPNDIAWSQPQPEPHSREVSRCEFQLQMGCFAAEFGSNGPTF